uniref:Uncharacterized protein n=1 Tax=Angiostrongylus cantonensis TaxID=6313 RepID=A0A0K0DMT1_ANGCA
MVTSRQKQLDSRTTITHTTITLSEQDSTNSNATVGAPIGTKCTIPKDVQPGKAPQMVVPNITAPVMSPLLLRINPLQIAVVAHLNRLVVCTPICEVETWKTEPHSAQYRLVMSATVPGHCTFVMPCSVAYVATTQHIINSPVITVAAFCLPVKQKTKVPAS